MKTESIIQGLYKRIGNLMRARNAFEKEAVMYKKMMKEQAYSARRHRGDMERLQRERDEAYRQLDTLRN